jgi:hypothetical protein
MKSQPLSRVFRMIATTVACLLALVFAPIALALGLAWFAWRLGVYATAKRASGTITGWTGEGDPGHIEAAVAHPHLTFTDHDDVERAFTSRIGYNIYDDPPPQGEIPVRFHLTPVFYAEIDDRAQWFTGPALLVLLAVCGSFITWLARLLALPWFWA